MQYANLQVFEEIRNRRHSQNVQGLKQSRRTCADRWIKLNAARLAAELAKNRQKKI